MPLELRKFDPSLLDAVRALNQRLRAGNMHEGFLIDERVGYDATGGASRLHREQFVMVDGANVRGGVLLIEHQARVGNQLEPVGNLQSPVSEGPVNPKQAHVAGVMLSKMMKLQPRLFGVGMGDIESPWARVLKAMKWRVQPVPFFFRPVNARAFLTNIGPLRSTAARRLAASLGAYTGVGSLALGALRFAKRSRLRTLQAIPVQVWEDWVDPIWEAASRQTSFACRRMTEDLRSFLPIGDRDLIAWRLEDKGRPVGWAAAFVHPIPGSQYFGRMRVGTMLDGLALPGYEERVVATATRLIEGQGADIVLANQSHRVWRNAYAKAGFMTSRSNYMLGTSPVLSQSSEFDSTHLTRADGDGRMNL